MRKREEVIEKDDFKDSEEYELPPDQQMTLKMAQGLLRCDKAVKREGGEFGEKKLFTIDDAERLASGPDTDDVAADAPPRVRAAALQRRRRRGSGS